MTSLRQASAVTGAWSADGILLPMIVVSVILFTLAVVALTVGMLGFAGRLPRNRFFGVHTEAARYSDDIFRIVNRVAAPTTVAAGALLLTGALTVLATDGFAAMLIGLGVLLIALFTLGAGATAGARAATALAPQPSACGVACGGCSIRDTCRP